eukprot:694270-Heterocapsa_arctica.AAC.1
MGYAWLHHAKKDPDLQEFLEIANFLENGIRYRLMTEDDEEQEVADGDEGIMHDDDKKGMMTESTMKKIVDM